MLDARCSMLDARTINPMDDLAEISRDGRVDRVSSIENRESDQSSAKGVPLTAN
jgi:hypothetical protein